MCKGLYPLFDHYLKDIPIGPEVICWCCNIGSLFTSPSVAAEILARTQMPHLGFVQERFLPAALFVPRLHVCTSKMHKITSQMKGFISQFV